MPSVAKILPFLFSAALVAAVPCAVFGADPLVLTHVEDWRVQSAEGDRVGLSENQGVLRVDYAVEVNRPRLVGYNTNMEGGFTVALARPVLIKPGQARVCFEARMPDTPDALVEIRPLIEDARGERLSYKPAAERVFARVPGGWTSLRTQAFDVTEAGGAAHGIYEAEGGDQNAWPDGQLRLLGFQVRVYASVDRREKGTRSSTLFLGDVSIGSLELPDIPFAYADALLKSRGDYRLAFDVRAAFQGAPVEESESSLFYDPVDESARRRKIIAPIGSLQNSWVRYRATGPGDSVAAEGEFRWELDRPPADEKTPGIVNPSRAPVIGMVRVNPDRLKKPSEVGGVYGSDEPLRVVFRVFPAKGSAGLRLKWRLASYAFDAELANASIPVTAGGDHADIAVDLPRDPDHDAYRLGYSLVDAAGKTLDTGVHVLGIVRPAITARSTRSGPTRDRDNIKSHPYFRTTFVSESGRFKSEQDESDKLNAMMRESSQLAQSFTYMIDLADFEILPGVYDFRRADAVMDAAADQGFGVTIRLGHAEKASPYRWLNYTTPRNFDGAPLAGHGYYGSYSIADPDLIASWKRALRAIHDRYERHPAFEGYYLMQAGGEWPIPDEPWNGFIADYSWAAKKAFRDYLRGTLGLDLASLNLRWHTNHWNWNEVMPPLPTLSEGPHPDLRPQWMDFQRCKASWRDRWFVELAKDIRSYDARRVIIAYDGWENAASLAGLVDYLHNGGNQSLEGEDTLVDAWEQDHIGWISEPHHPHRWAAYGDPSGRGWGLDWTTYVMTAQAGAGGQNLHVYYMPNPTMSLAAHYGREFALDRFELFKPVLRELQGMKLVRSPKQVAVIQDNATLLAKHRTTFTARLADLRRWFDLLKQDSIEFEYYRPKNEHAYKLLVLNPLDEVMSRENIDTAARMAREGAWVVTNARAGRYVPDNASEEFPLLRSLGIAPPKTPFDTSGAGVVAKFTEGRELASDVHSLPFFSQADYRAALKDPAVGAN
ncbi:MAG TPA: beta-galactosidase, partial [Rariglobus sp.]